MPDENVAVLQRSFDALSEGGVDAMLEYIADDCEMITPSELASEPDTYRGHEGMRRYWSSFYEAMDRVDVQVLDAEEVAPDQVAASLLLRTRGRITGLEATQNAEMLVTVANGKARRMLFFRTRAEAVEAARAA